MESMRSDIKTIVDSIDDLRQHLNNDLLVHKTDVTTAFKSYNKRMDDVEFQVRELKADSETNKEILHEIKEVVSVLQQQAGDIKAIFDMAKHLLASRANNGH
jgi:cellulose biosynthesis protein BcsQ